MTSDKSSSTQHSAAHWVWEGVTALAHRGDTEEARRAFSRALDGDPNHFEALYWLGQTAQSSDSGLAYLERALRSAPRGEDARQQLIRQRLSAIAAGSWTPPTQEEVQHLARLWMAAHEPPKPPRAPLSRRKLAAASAGAAVLLIIGLGVAAIRSRAETPAVAAVTSTPQIEVLALEESTATPEPIPTPTSKPTSVGQAAQTPTPVPTSAPTPTPTPMPAQGRPAATTMYVNTQAAHVRLCPSLSCGVFTYRLFGESVRVLDEVEGGVVGNDPIWFEVELQEGGTLYYMHRTVLQEQPPG